MIARRVPTTGHHTYESVAAFPGPVQAATSTFTVMVGGVPIDLRFDDRGHATTIVFFHAAIPKTVKRYPVFSGATFTEHVDANRLFISDPSLYVDPRVKLGWYAGNKHQRSLQDDVTTIISRFAQDDGRLVFFGASGGGFASLYYSARFPGSVAVPVNPQTAIADYVPAIVDRYLDFAWDGEALDDLPVCTDVRRLYSESVENSVIFVQNSGDRDHMERHFTPFMDSLPAHHAVSPLLVDVGEGHVPPPRPRLAEILTEVVGRR